MKNSGAINMYLAFAGLLTVAEILLLASGNGILPVSGLILFILFFSLSISAQKSEKFKGLSFTLQIFAFVSFTMYFPEMFTDWGFDTNKLIVPSIQVIMFGMGTKLNIRDFIKEFSKPIVVIAGTLMVFVLMPLAALLIIKVWNFPPEVAAGIILVGACPGGVASNVMTYLAKGNLALSVTVTTFATLLSPLLTPLIMKLLAGQLIEVNAPSMMISIVNMILIPIFAGIVANKILYGKTGVGQEGFKHDIACHKYLYCRLYTDIHPFPSCYQILTNRSDTGSLGSRHCICNNDFHPSHQRSGRLDGYCSAKTFPWSYNDIYSYSCCA